MDGGDGGKEDGNNKQRLEWATMNLERGVVVGAGEKKGGNASRKPPIGIVRLFLACMVSGGIQYGWALQLSLLSPYSQVLVHSSCSCRLLYCSSLVSVHTHYLVFSDNFHGLIDV
jgi:hypothetical protein